MDRESDVPQSDLGDWADAEEGPRVPSRSAKMECGGDPALLNLLHAEQESGTSGSPDDDDDGARIAA